MRSPIIVLKFGSSVLRHEEDLPRAVHEIYRWYRNGYHVVAVVSAFAGTTDKLLAQAASYSASADAWSTAALVATGESYSAALLGLALDRAGIPAGVLDASAIGMETSGTKHDSDPVGVNVDAVRQHLENRSVAVIPGFVGRSPDGSVSLLGRGGSDVTAVFLAQRLGGQCRLIKDQDGLYESDPAVATPVRPRRFHQLTFADALDLDGRALQKKAVQFAQQHEFPFDVASVGKETATRVGLGRSILVRDDEGAGPLRVGLVGLGTVGLGVLRRLASEPEKFEVTKVAVLDPDKRRDFPVPKGVRLTNDAWEVVESDCDVVIELIGGRSPAEDLVSWAIQQGKHVITANKLLLAAAGETLRCKAERNGVSLLYSAAAGGAVPMLEAVRRIAQANDLLEVRGVLNGTCNFVLDRILAGDEPGDAVRLAQAHGFAEADPTLDLDGSDAAQKLLLLAHVAFGRHIPFEQVAREGIHYLREREVRRAPAAGLKWRLVATVRREGEEIACRVRPEALSVNDPFAIVEGEQNCLTLRTSCGQTFMVRGRGAGRWPTAEAVFADALDLWRSCQVTRSAEEKIAAGGAA